MASTPAVNAAHHCSGFPTELAAAQDRFNKDATLHTCARPLPAPPAEATASTKAPAEIAPEEMTPSASASGSAPWGMPIPELLKQKVPQDVRLAKFTVSGRCGKGSYGEVYKAMTPLGADLAVKVMQKRDAKVTEMQRREVELLKELSGQHPSIVNLLGWRSTTFNIQLLLPWYQADLHGFISKDGRFINVGVARKCAQQMTQGVAFGCVVHRMCGPWRLL